MGYILVTIILIGQSAFSADQVQTESKKIESSFSNIHLGAQLIGVGSNYMAAMQGVKLGYSLAEDMRIGLEYKTATKMFNEVDRNWLDKTAYVIAYTQFVSPSFFIKAQIDSRVDNLKQNPIADNPDYFYEFSAKSTALGLLIGNEFKLSDHFAINCEWIGLAVPLSSEISKEVKGTYYNDGYALVDFEKEKENYTTRVLAYVLNISVNYSF